MSATHHAAAELGVVARYIAPRWKAVFGFVVALAGALATSFPDSAQVRSLLAVGTAIATALGVHLAPANVPATPAAAEPAVGP